VLTGPEAFVLIATVFAAVYHAEVVALRVGEPFGTLVLAVAVTTIEVALIVSVMITGGTETAGLARDTLFAVVMIVCNGIIGTCLLVGGLRHHEQGFQLRGRKCRSFRSNRANDADFHSSQCHYRRGDFQSISTHF
jgi:Ca2+:H+ antiporter